MENVSDEEKLESIQAFQSTIRKSENALTSLTQKGNNTTLLKKRLNALYIGLAMLEKAWNQTPHQYTKEEIAEAQHVLTGLFPSLLNMYSKSKAGSPQKTLLKRRMKAFERAVRAMDDFATK
ncbi:MULTISPECIES: hypothetical protein [unclassified Paenibacillus]|uniref:hypothetical protein n=1 Tax=unclassified Paenibacillus TaxID=185978 RepID=UPI00042990BC|nr:MULTISPECIES: hypothetical protein [unclassified Paenibacillus]KGP78731.1 hypothetical protein P364_0126345 [Paenibacillus sp. MAEPY2]KGP88788.1 hypothetical protein P363_0106040 [Paenibacillus sp. MAEPY1]